jgi:hypothetical protein
MTWLRARLSYANVLATLAAFIALGAGAYAAQNVSRNSVSLSALKFPVGADGVTKTDTVPGSATFKTVAKTKIRVNDKGGVMLVSGAVEIDNTANSKPAVVTLRATMNGKPEEGTFTTTVAPNATDTGLAYFLCDEMPPGTYTVALQAIGADVTFGDRTLTAEAVPQI